MNQQEDLAAYFVKMLAKQDATPEEKKIQALIKAALYGDNLFTFIDEVSKAFNGCGKVSVDTVKGITEYFKANSEVQIRNNDLSEEEKERLVKEASNYLVQCEVWVLGALAHLGYLSYPAIRNSMDDNAVWGEGRKD